MSSTDVQKNSTTTPANADQYAHTQPRPDDPNHPDDGYEPVILPGHTLASVTDKISSIVLRRHTPLGWVTVAGRCGDRAPQLAEHVVARAESGVPEHE